MALTNVTFNYNVAKIIDTPWNTIINGLNYTKTNLAPLALKYTLCNNYDSGMLLKEVAGNSIKTGVPMEDFSWSNAVQDYNNINKYWILNTNHASYNENGPLIYCADKYTDENGFDYSVLTNPDTTHTKHKNCGQIWYQDNTYLFIYANQTYYSSGSSAYLYRFYKNEATNKLELKNTYSCTNGIMHMLFEKDGYLYVFKQYGTSSTDQIITKIEISSGIEKEVYRDSISGQGILTSYPTNVVNKTFYVKHCPSNTWYKYTFDDAYNTITRNTIVCEIDDSNTTSTSTSYVGLQKRFTHIYIEGEEQYLMILTLNSYHYDSVVRPSTLQVYKIEENKFVRKQSIVVDGFSLIPKNNWNTLFVGHSTGLKVFNWDPLEKQFVEKPTIYTTIQQFGFDSDERLWIMDGEGATYRYTYNQPLTVDYKFEYERYEIGTETIESYIDIRILNYMGQVITSKIKIKAVGNFSFESNKKEIEIQLTSNEYLRVPVYINGTGKYEIRI